MYTSPTYRAGHTPRYINDDIYDAVASRRNAAPPLLQTPSGGMVQSSRSPSPLSPGRINLEPAPEHHSIRPIDVTTAPTTGSVGFGQDKSRTLFEIQHMLRGRSAEDLVAIKRLLRSSQED
jgi:hypothetical protein